MIHSIKRYVEFLVLVGLVSAVPVFANTAKSNSTAKNKTVVVDIKGKKSLPLISKAIGPSDSHKYQVSVEPGKKVFFKVRSDKPVSLKIQTSEGVKAVTNEKYFEGVLSAAGDYVIEIISNDISVYTLEISGS
jgi:hypothetical protein